MTSAAKLRRSCASLTRMTLATASFTCAEVEISLGLLTDGGARYGAAGVRHLADLIEPEEADLPHGRGEDW